jgi:hypothetical protein
VWKPPSGTATGGDAPRANSAGNGPARFPHFLRRAQSASECRLPTQARAPRGDAESGADAASRDATRRGLCARGQAQARRRLGAGVDLPGTRCGGGWCRRVLVVPKVQGAIRGISEAGGCSGEPGSVGRRIGCAGECRRGSIHTGDEFGCGGRDGGRSGSRGRQRRRRGPNGPTRAGESAFSHIHRGWKQCRGLPNSFPVTARSNVITQSNGAAQSDGPI